jgi:predicted DNA binding protein
MRHVRFTAIPSPDFRPPLFDLIAATDWVRETRLLDWNLVGERPAMLFVVMAARERFVAALEAVTEVVAYDTSALDADRFALHMTLELPSSLARLFDALTTGGLIVVKPVVYRNGVVHGNGVGQPTDVQAALDSLPPGLDLSIESVRDFDVRREAPTATLSDRQLEAVQIAIELGYYESPRQATHTEIATELGCSSSTATEHLQKAERKLVTGAMASHPE